MENQLLNGLEVATLGGGCFWCVEAVLTDLRGVVSVLPGYSGGHVDQPSMSRSAARIPAISKWHASNSIRQCCLMAICCASFATHDPTTPGRQGNDVGPQYESAIFWQNETQREQAQAVIAEVDAQKIYDAPIVTKLLAPATFWPAEDYHRNYFELHPEQGLPVRHRAEGGEVPQAIPGSPAALSRWARRFRIRRKNLAAWRGFKAGATARAAAPTGEERVLIPPFSVRRGASGPVRSIRTGP